MPELFPLQGLCDFEEDFLRGPQSCRDATTAQGRALSEDFLGLDFWDLLVHSEASVLRQPWHAFQSIVFGLSVPFVASQTLPYAFWSDPGASTYLSWLPTGLCVPFMASLRPFPALLGKVVPRTEPTPG